MVVPATFSAAATVTPPSTSGAGASLPVAMMYSALRPTALPSSTAEIGPTMPIIMVTEAVVHTTQWSATMPSSATFLAASLWHITGAVSRSAPTGHPVAPGFYPLAEGCSPVLKHSAVSFGPALDLFAVGFCKVTE